MDTVRDRVRDRDRRWALAMADPNPRARPKECVYASYGGHFERRL